MNTTPIESFIEHKADTSMQCGNYSIDIPKLEEGQQYRFHFDMEACVGCHCCEVACNEQNNNPSDIKWRRVGEMESGVFPNVSQLFNSMSCNHCVDPECLRGCPTESYIKFDNGIVFHDDDTCIGCQYCTWNCPYEVPIFNPDRGIVTKCHMCHEKLDVGQTPACVQACPSGAIMIEKVNVAQWLEEDMEKQGVAPHLPDTSITKPTTRYTLPKIHDEESLKPANEHILKPAHAELPLVFMTVLTQISVGGFLALFLGDMINFLGFNLPSPNIWVALAVLLPSALGLPLSALHLGRPILAHTAMKNWKTSWLSREAIALGAYTGGASVIVGAYFFDIPHFLRIFMEFAVVVIGVFGIYAQSMIYRIKARPSWNRVSTTKRFLGTGYIGFSLTALVLLLSSGESAVTPILSLSLLLGLYQMHLIYEETLFYKYLSSDHKNYYPLSRTKRLLEEKNYFGKHKTIRIVTLGVFAIVLPILASLLVASGNFTAAASILSIAIVGSLASELLGRYLFYVTTVPLGLAGNFFAGNMRGMGYDK